MRAPKKKIDRSRDHSFMVELTVPPGVSVTTMCGYIRDAVKAMKGSLPLEDPLLHLDRESVQVKRYYRPRDY